MNGELSDNVLPGIDASKELQLNLVNCSEAMQGELVCSSSLASDNLSCTSDDIELSASSALDFVSPRFEALRALQTTGLEPPDRHALPLDNLNEYYKNFLQEQFLSKPHADCQQAAADEQPKRGTLVESSSASLDFLSIEFDALKALHTKGLLPPNPKVRPLDNLNRCSRILPQEVPESIINIPSREPRSSESIKAQERAKARTSLLLQKVAEQARQVKIFDAIAEKLMHGPLSFLTECYQQHGRVQVWTRHAHGVRGTLIGFLGAIDKHLNMVLQDVDEDYSVRHWVPRLIKKRGRLSHLKTDSDHNNRQSAELVNNSATSFLDMNQEIQEISMQLKELRMFPKLEYRRRHLKQVFLRGDCVVMVRRLP
eukprot:c21242_g1_i1 orf=551-1660(-)